MSNEEILRIQQHYKNGNAYTGNRQWQRSTASNMVGDLVSESSEAATNFEKNLEIIDVAVKNNQLYAKLDSGAEYSSQSSKGPHKRIITFKKRQNPKIAHKCAGAQSSSSSEVDSEEDMLPDLFNVVLQPEENDSSDFGGEEEVPGSVSEESSSSSKPVSKTHTNTKDRKSKRKKSIKSAHLLLAEEEPKKERR